MSKARVARLLRLLKERKERSRSEDSMKRWNDARARGKILCKDGVERTEKAWLNYLPPELGKKLRRVLKEGQEEERKQKRLDKKNRKERK